MSKEAMERILRAEEEARKLITEAERDAEESFKAAEDKISCERSAFYEKLKAERNEKMRRVDMQMRINTEEAKIKAEDAYKASKREYDAYLDIATQAAVNTVLE